MLGLGRRLGAATAVASLALLGLALPDARAGFSFTPFTGSPFLVGDSPASIAIGDLNGDAKPDLVTANQFSDNVTVLLGNGSGGFSQTFFGAGDGTISVAIGNLNGDGKPDLAAVNELSENVTVLLGDGRGGFSQAPGSPIGVGDLPQSIAVADLNADFRFDLVTANAASDNVTVLLGNGTGGFAQATGSPVGAGDFPSSVAVANLNAGASPDLAVANYDSDTVTVLLGDGSGGFTQAAGSPISVGDNPRGLAVANLNADGRQDIVTANEASDNVTVLLGNGTGGFTAGPNSPIAAGDGPQSVAIADLNADNQPDLATANITSGDVTILRNTSTAAFTSSPESLTFATQAAGTTSPPQSATLTSTGDAALNVSDVRITGTGATDFLVSGDGCTGAAVAVFTSCTVQVRFAPASPGAKTATLIIKHNGGVDAAYGLTGTGGPAIVGAPGSTGAQGQTGPGGAQGPVGPPGPSGANGPAGAAGGAGGMGTSGGTGPTGPQGLPGAQGAAGTAAAPTVVTCTARPPKRGKKKVRVSCRVKVVATTRVRLRRAGRTVATRRVRAGTHRLVFRVARGGRYRLRVAA